VVFGNVILKKAKEEKKLFLLKGLGEKHCKGKGLAAVALEAVSHLQKKKKKKTQTA